MMQTNHIQSLKYIDRPITDSVLLIWANYRQRLNDVGQSQTTSQLYEPITYIISNISTNHRHRLNDTGQSQTASHVYLRVYVYLALTSCRRGVEEMQWNSSITYNPHSTQQLISCLEGSGGGGITFETVKKVHWYWVNIFSEGKANVIIAVWHI